MAQNRTREANVAENGTPNDCQYNFLKEFIWQIVSSIFNLEELAPALTTTPSSMNRASGIGTTMSTPDYCQSGTIKVLPRNIPYILLVCISPIFVFALSWTVKRRASGKMPGCLYPLPIVDPCRRRLLYAAFWGTVAYETIQFFTNQENLIINARCFTTWQKPLVLLLNVLIYAFLHYPIMAGFGTDTMMGYLTSTLWTWMMLALRINEIVYEINNETDPKERIASIFQDIIPMLFTAFLSIYLLIYLGLAVRNVVRRKNKFYEPCRRPLHYMMQAESLYVRQLLKHREPSPKAPPPSFFRNVIDSTVRYRNVPYFRYSQTIVSTLVISGIFVYYILYTFFRGILVSLPEMKESTEAFVNDYAQLLNISRQDRMVKIVEAYFYSFMYAAIASGTFVAVLQIILLLSVLPCYRRDMLSIFQGLTYYIPPVTNAPHSYFNYAISYMGYQTIMFSWGCALQLILFTIIILAISWIVIVPLVYGFGAWIINKILNILPALAVTIVLMIIQKVVVAVVFTENLGRTMAVNNRRGYSNLAYIAFFKNLLVGLVGAVMRMVISLIASTIMFSRIDLPVLNRRLEGFDNGFNIYVGLVTVENYHLNPCLVTFANIVLDVIERQRDRRKAEYTFCLNHGNDFDDDQETPAVKRARRNQIGALVISGQLPQDTEKTNNNNKSDENDSAYGEDSEKQANGNSPVEDKHQENGTLPKEAIRPSSRGQQNEVIELAKATHPTTSDPSTSALLAAERISILRRAAAMRFKWHLAYTLIRNPRLITDRKLALGISLL